MDRFADIEALVAVIEAGTFSAAGERLGVAKSVISRRVSQLEQRLGSRLLHRTTRRLTLTDAGRNFYQRAVQILADLEDAEQGVTAEVTDLRGALKLAAPLSFGLAHLSDALTEFLDTYPAIELNLDLNDRSINLVEEGFDLAVRIGELTDSTLIARRIGTSRTVTCASRAYLERFGEPQHPDELQRHVGLQYSNVSYRRQWQYVNTGWPHAARPAAAAHARQQRRGAGLCRRGRHRHHHRSDLYPCPLYQGRQAATHPAGLRAARNRHPCRDAAGTPGATACAGIHRVSCQPLR